MLESYSAMISGLSIPCKIELMERLIKMLKNETKEYAMPTDEFIPEKTAEQIITELRESRHFRERIIEPFD